MSNTLIVPARLEKAAKELKDNMTILKGCSSEMKEVIELAAKQRVLAVWTLPHGDNLPLYKHLLCYYLSRDLHAYCLPDDIVIVVEPDKPQVPKWVSKKYTVCEVVNSGTKSYYISFPDNGGDILNGLPAALRCDGWIFKGWLHEGNEFIQASPSMFRDSDDSFGADMSECQDERGCSVSTAYASVWQKVSEK